MANAPLPEKEVVTDQNELRYFDPSQCCNCGPNTTVPPSELRVVPILPPVDGGTRRLPNYSLMCPPCAYATFSDTNVNCEPTELPSNWESLKRDVHEMDDWICVGCGQLVDRDKHREPQAHHIRPRSCGGSNRLSNVVTFHRECHNLRHNHQRIGLHRAKTLLGRVGNRLQDIEVFNEWMLPERPKWEALDGYKAQYHELDDLINHYYEMQIPTTQMEPFIKFLEQFRNIREVKYMHASHYHKSLAEARDEPVPEEVRDLNL